jgi:hypothetical protein
MTDRREENLATTTEGRTRGRSCIRFQPRVGITVRFRVGRDENLLLGMDRLSYQRRAESIRRTVRLGPRIHPVER